MTNLDNEITLDHAFCELDPHDMMIILIWATKLQRNDDLLSVIRIAERDLGVRPDDDHVLAGYGGRSA